jgi:hypothetical protein
MKQQFDGEQEKELPPTQCDEKFMFEMVRNIRVVFRKGVKEKMKEKGKCLMCHLKINRFSLGIYYIDRNLRLVMSSTLCIL